MRGERPDLVAYAAKSASSRGRQYEEELKDGRPAYVTAVSESDVVDGWRDHRAGGGIVIDVNSNEIVARGLSMPHSPRWHEGTRGMR